MSMKFKKILLQVLVSLVLFAGLASVYMFLPKYYTTIDNSLRDYFFKFRGPIPTTGEVVIVDIDEKSLKELGQWPWNRNKFAQVLYNLSVAGAGVIGLDIVFAEADNSNPTKVLKELGLEFDENQVPDYDMMLAQVIANTPTIVGYVFALKPDGIPPKDSPSVNAIFIEQNKGENESLLLPYRAILNIPIIQQNSFSAGFFNTIPDESGLVRSVPLAMKYDGFVYPSLSLEMLRAVSGKRKVYVRYDELGVHSIKIGETEIPTDRYGRIAVNFRGPGFTFKYLSAVDIYNGNFDKKDVEGKYILVGTSAAGLLDLRAIPYDSAYPGVEVHANVIDNILKGDFLSQPTWAQGADIVILFSVVVLTTVMLTFLSAGMSLLFMVAGISGILYFEYYMLFHDGKILNIVFPLVGAIAAFLSSTVINYFFETRQKNMIKGKFATKVSPAVMEDILANADSDVLAGKEREITVFFSDVRNFTNISEAMGDPKKLIEFMNDYMDPMTDIIIKHEGTVDKFIGDAIMAYWNAPLDVENHADKAVTATLMQLHEVKNLNERMRLDPRFKPVVDMADRTGKPIVDIGIGLNTGVAIVGEMGSTSRADYTVIGDPINLGSRLESLCKYYNSKCNISNFTKEQLKGKYIYRFLDLVTVKGKSEPIEIWQVHDFEDVSMFAESLYGVSRERLDEELGKYHEAIKLYKEANFSAALQIFQEINGWKDKTNKAVYDMYIERCEHYIEVPPKDFNGVFVHTTKG